MPEAFIEVIENLVPAPLHAQACALMAGKGWYYGNRSSSEHAVPFWKMDLDGVPVFDAIWEAARPQCEERAGSRLRVIRTYANGHTFGQGGQAHRDDERPGTFTLLYYAMPAWDPTWQGETVFHDESGEIGRCVLPVPNRAVFFDARIPHAGRAPSRECRELRVTVAFKLESVPDELENDEAPGPSGVSGVGISETEREGARRVYRIQTDAAHVTALVQTRLQEQGKTVRLPGFRAGMVPLPVLEARYGTRTRSAVIGEIGNQAVERLLAGGGLPASVELIRGAATGDVELRLAVTHLPDLADVDCEHWELERLVATEPTTQQLLTQELHQAVLDLLDSAYSFPVAPALVERELASIRQAASDAELPESDEFGVIAERRVRLGAVIAELARRGQFPAPKPDPTLESRVIESLISRARVSDRPATPEELQALLD